MRKHVTRIAGRDLDAGSRVQKYAVVGDGKDAGQLVGDYDDRCAKICAQLEDQIIKQARADRIEADGSPKNRMSGSNAIARAGPARFCIPALLWLG